MADSLRRGGHKPPLLRYENSMADDPKLSPIRTGLACRCPRCGKGRLFQGFLDLRPRCEVCGLDYGFADAGDGPAVFMILIAGFIVVGCALIVEFRYEPPLWLHALLWLPLILATTLAAAALHEGPDGGIAISSQAAEGRADSVHAMTARAARGPLVPGRAALAALRRPDRARHLAARAQGLEGRPDRDAGTPPAATRRSRCRRPANGPRMTPENSEFTRVRMRAEFLSDSDALVYTSGSAIRDDVKGAGYFVFSPAQPGRRAAGRGQSRLRAEPSLSRATSGAAGHRRRRCAGRKRRRWFVVATMTRRATSGWCAIHRAMAAVKGWGDVAPFYIEQEAPVPPGGLPHPAPLKVAICATITCNTPSPGTGLPPCWRDVRDLGGRGVGRRRPRHKNPIFR